MDQQQLVAFERIVREGSFNRAARLLDVSQATISVRIQALEKELGGPLFVRGGRRATLTEAGEAFLPYARRALDVIAAGREAAWHAPAGREGRVVVGAVDSIADGFLVPIVARYVREHPRVALSIRTGHTPQIVQELTDGIVRLGLVTWQYATGAVGVEALVRFHEPLIAVVAPAHPLATRTDLTVEQILAEGDPYHETVWGTADDGRLTRGTGQGRGSREFPHGLMRQLILRGIGTGFLPQPFVQDDILSGRLVALPLRDGDGLSRELALVRHASGDPLPQAARDLVAIVQAEVARLR